MSGNKTQKPPAPTPDNRYDTSGGTMPSTPGGTNVSMWNTRFDAACAAAPVVDQKWNTRFDYQPSRNGGTTYLGKSMPSSLVAANAKKPC